MLEIPHNYIFCLIAKFLNIKSDFVIIIQYLSNIFAELCLFYTWIQFWMATSYFYVSNWFFS